MAKRELANGSKKVLRAMTIGLAAMMALTPATNAVTVMADENPEPAATPAPEENKSEAQTPNCDAAEQTYEEAKSETVPQTEDVHYEPAGDNTEKATIESDNSTTIIEKTQVTDESGEVIEEEYTITTDETDVKGETVKEGSGNGSTYNSSNNEEKSTSTTSSSNDSYTQVVKSEAEATYETSSDKFDDTMKTILKDVPQGATVSEPIVENAVLEDGILKTTTTITYNYTDNDGFTVEKTVSTTVYTYSDVVAGSLDVNVADPEIGTLSEGHDIWTETDTLENGAIVITTKDKTFTSYKGTSESAESSETTSSKKTVEVVSNTIATKTIVNAALTKEEVDAIIGEAKLDTDKISFTKNEDGTFTCWMEMTEEEAGLAPEITGAKTRAEFEAALSGQFGEGTWSKSDNTYTVTVTAGTTVKTYTYELKAVPNQVSDVESDAISDKTENIETTAKTAEDFDAELQNNEEYKGENWTIGTANKDGDTTTWVVEYNDGEVYKKYTYTFTEGNVEMTSVEVTAENIDKLKENLESTYTKENGYEVSEPDAGKITVTKKNSEGKIEEQYTFSFTDNGEIDEADLAQVKINANTPEDFETALSSRFSDVTNNNNGTWTVVVTENGVRKEYTYTFNYVDAEDNEGIVKKQYETTATDAASFEEQLKNDSALEGYEIKAIGDGRWTATKIVNGIEQKFTYEFKASTDDGKTEYSAFVNYDTENIQDADGFKDALETTIHPGAKVDVLSSETVNENNNAVSITTTKYEVTETVNGVEAKYYYTFVSTDSISDEGVTKVQEGKELDEFGFATYNVKEGVSNAEQFMAQLQADFADAEGVIKNEDGKVAVEYDGEIFTVVQNTDGGYLTYSFKFTHEDGKEAYSEIDVNKTAVEAPITVNSGVETADEFYEQQIKDNTAYAGYSVDNKSGTKNADGSVTWKLTKYHEGSNTIIDSVKTIVFVPGEVTYDKEYVLNLMDGISGYDKAVDYTKASQNIWTVTVTNENGVKTKYTYTISEDGKTLTTKVEEAKTISFNSLTEILKADNVDTGNFKSLINGEEVVTPAVNITNYEKYTCIAAGNVYVNCHEDGAVYSGNDILGSNASNIANGIYNGTKIDVLNYDNNDGLINDGETTLGGTGVTKDSDEVLKTKQDGITVAVQDYWNGVVTKVKEASDNVGEKINNLSYLTKIGDSIVANFDKWVEEKGSNAGNRMADFIVELSKIQAIIDSKYLDWTDGTEDINYKSGPYKSIYNSGPDSTHSGLVIVTNTEEDVNITSFYNLVIGTVIAPNAKLTIGNSNGGNSIGTYIAKTIVSYTQNHCSQYTREILDETTYTETKKAASANEKTQDYKYTPEVSAENEAVQKIVEFAKSTTAVAQKATQNAGTALVNVLTGNTSVIGKQTTVTGETKTAAAAMSTFTNTNTYDYTASVEGKKTLTFEKQIEKKTTEKAGYTETDKVTRTRKISKTILGKRVKYTSENAYIPPTPPDTPDTPTPPVTPPTTPDTPDTPTPPTTPDIPFIPTVPETPVTPGTPTAGVLGERVAVARPRSGVLGERVRKTGVLGERMVLGARTADESKQAAAAGVILGSIALCGAWMIMRRKKA